MIPDFPHNIRIRLAQLNLASKLRQLTGQRLSNVRKQQKIILIGPILFLCYEESLVSSSLNSKQLRFHGAHPNKHAKWPPSDLTPWTLALVIGLPINIYSVGYSLSGL